MQSGYMGAEVAHTLIGECVANTSLSFHNGAKIQAHGGGTAKLTVVWEAPHHQEKLL